MLYSFFFLFSSCSTFAPNFASASPHGNIQNLNTTCNTISVHIPALFWKSDPWPKEIRAVWNLNLLPHLWEILQNRLGTRDPTNIPTANAATESLYLPERGCHKQTAASHAAFLIVYRITHLSRQKYWESCLVWGLRWKGGQLKAWLDDLNESWILDLVRIAENISISTVHSWSCRRLRTACETCTVPRLIDNGLRNSNAM